MRRRVFAAAFEERRRFIFARCHSDVASERQRSENVLGLAYSLPEQCGSEANREAGRIDAGQLRGEEVSELVHEDDEPEDDDWSEPAQHPNISLTWLRAAASAASKFSRLPAGMSPSASSADEIARGISENRILPARKAATAHSLAALNTAGAEPPTRPASMPRRSAGNRWWSTDS